MNDIPPEMLAEVLREIEAERGDPNEYSVPMVELLKRLIAKGWQPKETQSH
jgi:hypothetical protein